jgi:hypothetical protein
MAKIEPDQTPEVFEGKPPKVRLKLTDGADYRWCEIYNGLARSRGVRSRAGKEADGTFTLILELPAEAKPTGSVYDALNRSAETLLADANGTLPGTSSPSPQEQLEIAGRPAGPDYKMSVAVDRWWSDWHKGQG